MLNHQFTDNQDESHELRGSSFAQQKIPHLQVEWNGCKARASARPLAAEFLAAAQVMAAAFVVGIILLLLSLLTNQIGLASVEAPNRPWWNPYHDFGVCLKSYC